MEAAVNKEWNCKLINHLIERFNSCQLPKAEWTHEAHLLVGFWYLDKLPLKEAMEVVKVKISEHNLCAGTGNTDTIGYHETITKFWLTTIAKYKAAASSGSLGESFIEFLKSDRSRSSLPLEYYSKEMLFSLVARKQWVEPDLKPL